MNPYREWRARIYNWLATWRIALLMLAVPPLILPLGIWATLTVLRRSEPAIPAGECRETLTVLRAGDRQDVVCPYGARMQMERASGEVLVRCTCEMRR